MYFELDSAESARRRHILAQNTYTWSCSFTVAVRLSDTEFSSETDFEAFIVTTITSDEFVDAVAHSTGATVDTSSVTIGRDGAKAAGDTGVPVGAAVGGAVGGTFLLLFGVYFFNRGCGKATAKIQHLSDKAPTSEMVAAPNSR